jgi:integrase
MGKLTARGVQTLGDGMHADGNNLYLLVRNDGRARSWVFRYKTAGKTMQIGLGSFADRPLAEARRLAFELRNALANGEDPKRRLDDILGRKEEAPSFAEAARRLIETKRPGWRNAKHAAQWEMTLREYAFPRLGKKHPADIGLTDVVAVLSPIWQTKTETATRLRQRIEAVLDYCAVHGWRDGDNPARWRGVLDKVLPAPERIRKRKHFAAAPYDALPGIMQVLRQQRGIAALCLRFIILTACRSSEARGAQWSEIDLERRIWTIPAERMKAGRAHRVPLSDEAVAVLNEAAAIRTDDSPYVFPGPNTGKPLWDVGVSKILRAACPDATVHGMRAAFKTWAEEKSRYPSKVIEAALAHIMGDKVEAAYMRSDLFDLRRSLMDDWARHCCPVAAQVVRLEKRRIVR